MQRSRIAFSTFTLLLCLSACGTKGPLYTPVPPSTTTSAAATDDNSRAATANPK